MGRPSRPSNRPIVLIKENPKKAKSVIEYIIYDMFGKGDFSRYEEVTGPNLQVHLQGWKTIFNSTLLEREVVEKVDHECAKAFRFTGVEIHDLLIVQDKIWTRWEAHGIQKDDFFNIKKSGNPFHLEGQTMYQLNRQGQTQSIWQSWDMHGLMRQIDESFMSEDSLDCSKIIKKGAFLSSRERECLKYLLRGKTAKETAQHLQISFRTIEYYFENIKNKLDCDRKKDLYIFARILEKHHAL